MVYRGGYETRELWDVILLKLNRCEIWRRANIASMGFFNAGGGQKDLPQLCHLFGCKMSIFCG